jgi:hypothetical protein
MPFPQEPDYCNMECREMLIRLCQRYDSLERSLIGNGQPGEIVKLRNRIGSLEDFRAWVRGAFWAIGGALTLILTGLGILLGRRG